MGSVQQLGQAFYNHYNQSQELAADAIGLQYAAAAGYDPRVGALLFERMAIEVPQSLTAGFFSSHPSSLERVDAAQKRINVLIAQGYNLDREFRAGRLGIDEYRQMKKVLTGE
jgi:predicted Zn-dependent protease